MNEPDFIPNSSPHEVVMPAGARNAVGKSAQVGEPAIHRVLAQIDAHAATPPVPAENTTAAEAESPQRDAATLAAHETANPIAPAEDQRSDTPMPQAVEHAPATAADLEHHISDDLAARLAALKAENDQVLQQLEELETQMGKHP